MKIFICIEGELYSPERRRGRVGGRDGGREREGKKDTEILACFLSLIRIEGHKIDA